MHNWTLEGMPNNLEHLLNVIWYKKYNKDIWSYCIWNTFDYTRQKNERWEVRGEGWAEESDWKLFGNILFQEK